MYEVFCEAKFSAAHSLRNYDGVCKNDHGHNWRVRVHVRALALDDTGFVIDFDILKSQLDSLAGELDHKNLNELRPFDHINPTSENLAKYFYTHMTHGLDGTNCELARVEIYEQDDACATYMEP